MLTDEQRLQWWREARFGMFIHWGIYAVPAGIWRGQAVPGLGEWIMHNGRIPLADYAPLAGEFNPVKFDAEQWVTLAAEAGMKYLVITSKHHDGFAMFKSAHPYNLVDDTPYGRDVMKDLAAACARHGLKLCFYYSQDQDWATEGASGHWDEVGDLGWRGKKPPADKFAAYLESKVKPQLRELLTQYGPVGLIWFDTPVAITPEQSQMLKDFVHQLQPECLVSGRVGHGLGDYGSLGDNQIPCGPVKGAWETPATLNDTWGFRSDDHNWKSLADLLYLLVDLTSKGVNYLLNVGPTAEGVIPRPSVDLLQGIGRWMKAHGEAIYSTQPNPYPYEFDWGRITTRGNRLYLLLYHWPDQLALPGLRNRVLQASLLADPTTRLPIQQTHDCAADQHELSLTLPAVAPDPLVNVIVVEFEGDLDVDTSPLQQPDGQVSLPAYLATFHQVSTESPLTLSPSRVIQGWRSSEDSVSWEFKASRPGNYLAQVVISSPHRTHLATSGHEVSLTLTRGEATPESTGCAEATLSAALHLDNPVASPRARYFPEHATTLGTVNLPARGLYRLHLTATQIIPEATEGLPLARVELSPVTEE